LAFLQSIYVVKNILDNADSLADVVEIDLATLEKNMNYSHSFFEKKAQLMFQEAVNLFSIGDARYKLLVSSLEFARRDYYLTDSDENYIKGLETKLISSTELVFKNICDKLKERLTTKYEKIYFLETAKKFRHLNNLFNSLTTNQLELGNYMSLMHEVEIKFREFCHEELGKVANSLELARNNGIIQSEKIVSLLNCLNDCILIDNIIDKNILLLLTLK
jgi:hypothetical protein